ncbi:hypothetical protein Trydic_g3035 [Trypoxylus dichotomus]
MLGITSVRNYSLESGVGIQNLQLVEDEAGLVGTWTATGNTDDCVFQIAISSNAASQNGLNLETRETSFVLPNPVACSEITVQVSAGTSSVTDTITIVMRVTTAPYLRDMITSCNSIQMIWEAEPYEQNMCEVTHFQMFCLSDTHNFTIPQMVTDVQHRTFDILITLLRPDIYYICNGFIFTTLAGFSPPSANIEFWSNLDSVRDLEVVETADSIRATWEAPLNSEECGVAYEVIYTNEVLGTSTIEVVGLSHDFDIELIPCTDYTITVTPISFTGSKGTAVSQDFTPSIRVGGVDNLIATDAGDSVVLSWSPASVGVCPLTYIVQNALNGVEGDRFDTTEGPITFDRIPCSESQFSVQVLSEGVYGPVVVTNLELGSADINSITEVVTLNLDGTVLSWSPPITIGLCEISYIVDIENTFGMQQTATRSTSIDLELIPCSNNKFTVRGTANGILGAPASVEDYAPVAELAPPSHVSTNPAFTSATITLRGQAIAENLCRVETAILECSDVNGGSIVREIDVMDNTPRIFTVVLDDLEQDTIYTCVARLQDSASGNEFAFRTVPLVEKDLIISDVSENGFLVSWIEDYGQQFVIGYELVIQSLGPAHRVPDGCSVDSSLFSVSLSNDELSSVFIEGLPDYSYRVVLTTYYTLGISLQSNTASARTLTGVPDIPANLALDFVSGSSETYDVSAILSWSSPCELNGGLRGFGVNVTASFLLGGVQQRVTVALGVDAEEEYVNAIFGKTIADINPFFTYEVAVNVIAATEGPSTVLEFVPPPACVCGVNDVFDV